jgi:predicted NBD/HSP70 family sugar kinase
MVSYNTAELRRQNRNRVFRYIYSSETPVSKQDVAQNLSLSLPTVGQNLRELLDNGLLELQGTFDSTGGRKPKAIGVTASFKYAVGIMISNRHIHIACIDLRAHQMCEQALFKPFTGDETYCKELSQILETFLDENGIDRSRLLGVGIALPGIPDEEHDELDFSAAVNARHMPMSLVRKYIPYPCFFENDANAGGVAEWWNSNTNSTMVYLSVQKGVGGAVLLDGTSYMGHHHHSGEFGHMCIVPGGRPCRCGKQGCLEAYCSTARFSDDLGISREDFFLGLEQGNEQYQALWDDYLAHLAIGIYNIHIVLDCDIVLGGVLAQFIEPYLDDLRARIKNISCFETDGSYLRCSKYRKWTSCVGVALHFISEFIDSI